MHCNKDRRGFTLLGLLLAIAIVCVLYYIAVNTYFKKPILDKSTEKSLSEQGIDISSHQAILESTKEKLEDINKKLLNKSRQIEDIK